MTEPYISPQCDLVIPFDAHERFRWWQGGQDIAATLRDLGVLLRVDILRLHIAAEEPPRTVADREAAKIRQLRFEEAGAAQKTRKAVKRTHADPSPADVDPAWNSTEEDDL